MLHDERSQTKAGLGVGEIIDGLETAIPAEGWGLTSTAFCGS